MWTDDVRRLELDGEKTNPNFQIKMDVCRIFMHLPNEFTFVTEKNNEFELHHFEACSVKWIKDVDPEKPMWIEGFKGHDYTNHESTWGANLTVHLHNSQEINSADWQRQNGKFMQKGSTNVID